VDKEYIDKYLNDNILNKVLKDDLIRYFHLSRTKKSELFDKIREQIKTEDEVKRFYYHFRYRLGISGSGVEHVLNITRNERHWMIEEKRIKIAFEKSVNSSYGDIEIGFFDLYEILSITNNQLEEWREEHTKKVKEKRKVIAKKAAKVAAETRQRKKEQMPKWVKEAKLEWIMPLKDNIKRWIAISKLSDEHEVATATFKFAELQFIGTVYDSGIMDIKLCTLEKCDRFIKDNSTEGKNSWQRRKLNANLSDNDIKKYYECNALIALQNQFNLSFEKKLAMNIPINKDTEKIRCYLERRIRNIINTYMLTLSNFNYEGKALFEYVAKNGDKDVEVLYEIVKKSREKYYKKRW